MDVSVAETGATALNAISYNGCTAGPYNLLIKPNAGVAAVLKSYYPELTPEQIKKILII